MIDKANCSKCGFGYDFSKVLAQTYDEQLTQPREAYFKIIETDERIQKYRVSEESTVLDWERLRSDNYELYMEMNEAYTWIGNSQTIETYFLASDPAILEYAKCIHCGEIGSIKLTSS